MGRQAIRRPPPPPHLIKTKISLVFLKGIKWSLYIVFKIAPIFSSWFSYFYLWGVIWNVMVTAVVLIGYQHFPAVFLKVTETLLYCLYFPLTSSHFLVIKGGLTLDVLLILILLCVQVIRRCYESCCVTIYGNSQMHVGHFLYGLLFYTSLAPLTLLQLRDVSHVTSTPWEWNFWAVLHWYHILGIVLFVWSSKHQYRCHVILADIKQHQKLPQVYAIPHGDWFDHVSSPHYTAEILIYSALFICSGCGNYHLLLPLLSTISTLTLVARGTHQWYIGNFKNYPKHRKIIIPFIY